MKKTKIFISYSSDDNKKMTLLSELINDTDNLEPIVIANRKSPQSLLSEKVTNGIHEADVLIPILTKRSIMNQWVNQEIGYTYCLKDKTIIPLVEDTVMEKLKGFIHKQLDLPYVFNGSNVNPRSESISFKKIASSLICDLSGNNKQTNEDHNPKYLNESLNSSIKTDLSDKTMIHVDSKIYFARPGFDNTLSGNSLQQDKGIVSIWAHVTDIHNLITEKKRFLYILGYATNDGKELNNPMMARYPNSWHIVRITPTKENPTGFWKFGCNSIEKKSLEISSNKLLDGWHMFSVIWSRNDNYVIFLIDDDIIDKKELSVWPTNFTKSIFVGTWPNKASGHFFNSEVGNLKIMNSGYDKTLIKELYANKPK